MRLVLSLLVFAVTVTLTALAQPRRPRPADAQPPKLKILFLGDNAGHKPAERFKQLQPVFAARNIELTYTDKLADLNAENLGEYDGLMIYANHTKISAGAGEGARSTTSRAGKGFIPLHCASYCFLNSPKYVELVGAQFRSHDTGTFRAETVKPDHPIMKGYQSFTSWDETYVHTKHNEKDRTVLEVRVRGRAEGAVDVGADAGQGPRLLHRVGPRSADVGPPRVPQPARTRRALGLRARPGARGRRTSTSRR